MATEYTKDLDAVAEYQNNHLLCWASVALTCYRAKFGKSGKGASFYSMLSAPGGAEFMKIYTFVGDIEFERSNLDPGSIEQGKAAAIANNSAYANQPDGLGSGRADAFFKTFLKMKSIKLKDPAVAGTGDLNAGDKAAVRDFIKANAPVVVFRKLAGGAGHLQLIYGYWDGGDAQSPQIKFWDPEGPLTAVDEGRCTNDFKQFPKYAKFRLLWDHFQQQVVKQLATDTLYYY